MATSIDMKRVLSFMVFSGAGSGTPDMGGAAASVTAPDPIGRG